MNPYMAGFLVGLLLLAAFYFTGQGLGASGAMKRVAVTAAHTVAPAHVESNEFMGKYFADGKSPMKNRLIYMVLGSLVGAFISAAAGGRLKLMIVHSKNITARKRLWLAATGGVLFGVGAQLARGCTSGAAMSGMAVFSLAGFLTLTVMFGTAYAIAYFVRKNWI